MNFSGRDLDLARIPDDPDLQAWDQADLYALDQLPGEGRVLLVLDAFGALACALADRDRVSTGDSEVARLAMEANLQHNSLSPCTWSGLDEIEGEYDLAIIKVPRQKALLDAALARVRPHLRDGAAVLGAGMTKHVHNSTIKGFERWIGPTTPGEDFKLWLEPGVFAKQGIDPGSALLLNWIPRLPEDGRDQMIVDAGCGSGLLTATAAARNPRAEVVGTDESHLAVASTRKTLESFVNARAEVANVLATVADGSVNLVLSNPPQHQAAALSQQLLGMFIEEARRVLRPTGRVRMVANRHVNLNVALGEAFDRVRILDQDRQFMVCEAESPVSAAPRTV
jgi:16S rRNA G1207 methylase RsmC